MTGNRGPPRHLGNAVVSGLSDAAAPPAPPAGIREPLPERFGASGYPTPYSDVVALGVLVHQARMTNLVTRAARDSRAALGRDPGVSRDETAGLLRRLAVELVEYLLFVDEAPLTAPIEGTSGFAERFAAAGPLDSRGRSLRQFDLRDRLMRYPCSYMIYSEAFSGLPRQLKDAIHLRMWEILSGQESGGKYGRLSEADRNAVVEILADTYADLPEYFVLIESGGTGG